MGNEIMRKGFEALYSLLQWAPPDVHQEKIDIIKTIYDEIEKTLSNDSLDQSTELLQFYLFTSYQCVLTNIKLNAEELCSLDALNLVYDQIVHAFQKRQDVFEEGFLAFEGLLYHFERDMGQKYIDFFSYIEHGLKSDNTECIRLCCNLISDGLAYEISDTLSQKQDTYLPILFEHLQSNEIDRSVKVRCIPVISETYQADKTNRFDQYIDQTMSVYLAAAERCINHDLSESDIDVVEYIKGLQSALIESFTCLIQDAENKSMRIQQQIGAGIQTMVQFLISSANEYYKPSIVSTFYNLYRNESRKSVDYQGTLLS